MTMKKLLSMMLCLAMLVSCAFAETADTLPKKFNRPLTGGNGIRGYMNITASGVADCPKLSGWLSKPTHSAERSPGTERAGSEAVRALPSGGTAASGGLPRAPEGYEALRGAAL